MIRTALAIFAVALSGCVVSPPPTDTSCLTGEVQLLSDFDGARANNCEKGGVHNFGISISPEATPINPSPWYAFDLEAHSASRVGVEVRYEASRHRYHPKIKLPGDTWRPLSPDRVKLSEDGTSAKLTLDLPIGRTRIAAQELLDTSERVGWMQGLADRHNLRVTEIGRSVENRPVLALESGRHLAGQPLIIILGGQHPPEVPGTLGLRSFVETLYSSDDLTDQFLSSVHLIVIPELNPDGIAKGHWRLNAGLTDINRDWGAFEQPETRAARGAIETAVSRGSKPFLLLDFHATRRTIFYTPPDDFNLDPPNLTRDWFAGIRAYWDGEMPARSAKHTAGHPTAKTWFAETYGAPGITLEFADDAPRSEISAFAGASARALRDLIANKSDPETNHANQ